MTQQNLNFGTTAANDGEDLFSAFTKIQANFAELYAFDASSFTFTQSGGGTARSIQTYLREHAVKVTDYNTTCDGSTDNTAAFALAKATGRPIYIPDGHTVLLDAATWTTGARTVVFGDGPGSAIKWRNTSGSASLQKFTTTVMDVVYCDLTVNCNRAVHTDTSEYFAAIDFQAPSGSSLTLHRVNFPNGRIVDVRVVGPTASGESVRFDMEDCTFSDGLVGTASRAAQCVNVLDAVHWRCVNNTATLPSKPATYGRAGFIHDGVNRNGTDARGSLIAYGNRFNNIGRGTADTLGCIDVYYGADDIVMVGNTADQVCGRFLTWKADASRVVIQGNSGRDCFSSVAATATMYSLFGDLYDPANDKHASVSDNICGTSDGYGWFIDGGLRLTTTMTIASPGVGTATAHGLSAEDAIHFTTTGALPTGVTATTVYYVIATGLTADEYQFSATLGGAAVNTSGSQSGVHTLNKISGFSNLALNNPVAGACGITAIHVRNMGGVTVNNPMVDGGPIAIVFTAINGAFRINGGRLANQTNDAVSGNAGIGVNTSCDFSIMGTLIEDCTDRAIDLTAVKSYDIDVDIDTAAVGVATAGSTAHSRIRGRMRDVTTPWSKTSTDTLTEYDVDTATAIPFATRELTIASGAVTAYAKWHFIDTEADAASDDLDTINGGYEGATLFLYAASGSRDVVVKNGTGNITSPNGDITLATASDPVLLHKRGSTWFVVSRPDVATLTGSQTLTNKTIALGSNTVSGTTAQFNTALSDGDFATLAGAETLTNKGIDLTSNTLVGSVSEFNTALEGADFYTTGGTDVAVADGGTGASSAINACGNLGTWYVVGASGVAVARNSVNGAGDATETALATITLPAGAMGANGVVRVVFSLSHTSSANVKTFRVRWNGLAGSNFMQMGPTTTANSSGRVEIHNRNATNSQVAGGGGNTAGGWGSAASGLGTASVDTTAAVDIVLTCNWAGATSGETIQLEHYTVEVYKAA